MNSVSSLMPSPGKGDTTFLPMPPIETSLFTRSGWEIAMFAPTPPPIELPMMSTVSRPSPSRKTGTAPTASTIGWPSHGSDTPKPGNSST